MKPAGFDASLPPQHAQSGAKGENRKCWNWISGSDTLARVPRKIRQLVLDLEGAGFVRMQGGKGSHRKFRHLKFPGFVLISGHDGDDAQPYQEKHVRNALRHIQS
jgi:predicted RNA binding protein YcfA (HicA-like mRNA interferase family)